MKNPVNGEVFTFWVQRYSKITASFSFFKGERRTRASRASIFAQATALSEESRQRRGAALSEESRQQRGVFSERVASYEGSSLAQFAGFLLPDLLFGIVDVADKGQWIA